MASLYKKPVILNDPKTDKPVKTKSRKWWGRFKDEHGVERRVPLAVDKAAAPSMLNELFATMVVVRQQMVLPVRLTQFASQ